MRSATSALFVAALAAASAGCGNYSTEDLRFLSALPRRQDLTVAVPTSTGTGPTALATGGLASTAAYSLACPLGSTGGDAEIWKAAKPTSDKLNAAVAWIVGLVDNVRKVSPTHRSGDTRRWGPFDDDKHPGHEIQVVMERSWSGETPTYVYRFETRRVGTTPFTPLLWGAFTGDSASTGSGDVHLDFQAFWDAGVNDADTPHGLLDILYDRASDPVTIDLDLKAGTTGGFGASSFKYTYDGYASRAGSFAYKFTNFAGDQLEVATSYDAAGAGRLAVNFYPSGSITSTGSFRQCWDANACLVYVDDPGNLSCPMAQWPCSYNTVTPSACVPVPASPPPFTP